MVYEKTWSKKNKQYKKCCGGPVEAVSNGYVEIVVIIIYHYG
jgi:hypothetical protein